MKRNPVIQREITSTSITRVLVIGFSLVLVLMAAGGIIAVHSVFSIQANAGKLVREQHVTQRLIEDLEQEQITLSAIFYSLTGDPDTADPEIINKKLKRAAQNLQRMAVDAKPSTEQQQRLWGDLMQASQGFAVEAGRLLHEKGSPTLASRDLFRAHEKVIKVISGLVDQGFQRVSEAEGEIGKRSANLVRDSLTLLGTSLGLALIGSLFTVRVTRELFRSMTWQQGELMRVSWHMLADHESIARRFSHELHDELGQALAALKSNLAALSHQPTNVNRINDSARLVDEAIRNVRQLSQLLRPTILDDFGLDAGLRWLCEGFTERTGIKVEYDSNLQFRLSDEPETHLFRIAQEALTNVARHSGARRVIVQLKVSGEVVCLTIEDDGKGIQDAKSTQSLGMTGMRARARAAGGVFRVQSPKNRGLRLEVEIPLPENIMKEDYEPHPHLTG